MAASAHRRFPHDDHSPAFPRARGEGLTITDSGRELLVYDLETHHLHHLNEVAALIWRQLDGQTGIAQVVQRAQEVLGPGVTTDTVDLALRGLAEAGLLANAELAPTPTQASGLSRRRLVKRAAVGGLLVPSVVSVTAVTAAQAESCVGIEGACRNAMCCPGLECDPVWLLCLVPVIECEQQGSRCDDQHPCCEGLECRNSMCQPPVIDCVPQGSRCDERHACCEGLECRDTECQPPVEVPCVPVNDRCFEGDVCCGDATCNGLYCEAPPVDECGQNGMRCDEQHPCCDGLECRDTQCQPPVEIPCVPANDRCFEGDVCCGDATCNGLYCEAPPVDDCTVAGDVCKSTADCCDGLTCLQAGVCG